VVVSERPTERGKEADWRNPWPVVGVRRGDPEPSPGVELLVADGYRAVFDVDPVDADRDDYQDHLNNTAAVRMFNELRIAYVADRLAPRWPRHVRREGLAVVVRESHVLYESEGWMHERFVGATRVASRRGKAAIVEQRLVEATTARPLAQAWFVQLLVAVEGVVDWPGWYWEMAAEVEGRPIPVAVDTTRRPWGPPQ
jgi:acyl-CoA thioesterase FadM